MEEKLLYRELSYRMVGCAMQVRDELGYGFLEKVYENALMVALHEAAIPARQQVPLNVYYIM